MNLMQSPVCMSEAMAIGSNALSMQFHVEIEANTVRDWGKIPEYADALAQTCGEHALSEMDDAARDSMTAMTDAAETIYSNWFAQSFS